MNVGQVALENEEAAFASWLATLDNPATDPLKRALAIKNLSESYLRARTNEVSLLAQLESAQRSNGELRAFRQQIATLVLASMPRGVALVIESSVQTPGQKVPLRVVPKPEGA